MLSNGYMQTHAHVRARVKLNDSALGAVCGNMAHGHAQSSVVYCGLRAPTQSSVLTTRTAWPTESPRVSFPGSLQQKTVGRCRLTEDVSACCHRADCPVPGWAVCGDSESSLRARACASYTGWHLPDFAGMTHTLLLKYEREKKMCIINE